MGDPVPYRDASDMRSAPPSYATRKPKKKKKKRK